MNARITRNFIVVIAIAFLNSHTMADELLVRLKEAAQVEGPAITIGDVALLTGGTLATRKRIESLDLDSFRKTGSDCRVTRRQIEARILLSGIDRSQFSTKGASELFVHKLDIAEATKRLEESIASDLARQFAAPSDSFSVRLMKPSQIKSLVAKLPTNDFSMVLIGHSRIPVGNTRLTIQFTPPNGEHFLSTLDVQVVLSVDVALASQPIPRGTLLDKSMFRVVRRAIMRNQNYAAPDEIIGRVTNRDMASNSIVLSSHVSLPTSRTYQLVKRNDLLDVIIQVGGSEIRLRGAKAVSSGNKGDSITVLNTRSNKQFRAIVADRNLAVVPFDNRASR